MKFNHTAHKEMWNWLADNLTIDNLVEKSSWPGWQKYKSQPCLCFACGYDDLATPPRSLPDCSHCPLEWPDVTCDKDMPCLRSIYSTWEEAVDRYDEFSIEDVVELKKVAKQIADLPVKDGVECI